MKHILRVVAVVLIAVAGHAFFAQPSPAMSQRVRSILAALLPTQQLRADVPSAVAGSASTAERLAV